MSAEVSKTSPVGPSISVVIRNRNEAAYMAHVLRALALQVPPPDEIVVVDNESSDESAELARAAGAKVTSISKRDFSYGRALNQGIGQAAGEIVVLLSAHSYPLGARFLDEARAPFADPRVAATSFRDVRNLGIHGHWTEPRTFQGDVLWKDLWLYGPSNFGCALRRSVWQQIPFDEQLESAEDKHWVQQALSHGYTIAPSSAFFWYMRQPPLWDGIKAFGRDQIASVRMSGQAGEELTLAGVWRATARQAVLTVRTGIKMLLRWMIVRSARAVAARTSPRLGSNR